MRFRRSSTQFKRVFLAGVLCCASWAAAGVVDTSAWTPLEGSPATAQSTGLAELTGTGLLHAKETGPGGAKNFVTAASGEGITFALRPEEETAGDAQRVWFSIRARRDPGAAVGNGDSFLLHSAAGGLLRTTVYFREDNAAAIPNGAPLTARGLSLHARSLLGGIDVSLAGTEWNTGAPVIAWDRWTTVGIEVVRGFGGRYVVSVNGTPVTGFVGLNGDGLSAESVRASLRIALPARAGVRYDLGGPLGTKEVTRTYSRLGTAYPAGAAVHRLLSIPGSLEAPWSPFAASGDGDVGISIDEFGTGGVRPGHRRAMMFGEPGAAGQLTTIPLGDAPAGPGGWSSVVLREVMTPPGATAEIRLEHQGAGTLTLGVHDGKLWNGAQVLLTWNQTHRYAVCVHLHKVGAVGERAVTLVDLSSDDFAEAVVRSAELPPLGAAIGQLGSLTLAGTVGPDGGPELGGVAVCRRVDLPMVDSYIAATVALPGAPLVTFNRLGAAFFAGYDADLVPGRPGRVDEDADSPMYLFPVAQAGKRLSDFLATSGAETGHTRGVRWLLLNGFVNELAPQMVDTYYVDSPQHALWRAAGVGAALGDFADAQLAAGNEFAAGTPIPAPGTQADPIARNPDKALAFAFYNEELRRLYRILARRGMRLADVEKAMPPAQQAALFVWDGIHFSAAGDAAYAATFLARLRAPDPQPCGVADVGRQGGFEGSDGLLDNNDFIVLIDLFFSGDRRADFGGQGNTSGPDLMLDNNDFVVFIELFFAGCP